MLKGLAFLTGEEEQAMSPLSKLNKDNVWKVCHIDKSCLGTKNESINESSSTELAKNYSFNSVNRHFICD